MKKRYIIPLFIFFAVLFIIYFTMEKYNIEQVKDVYKNSSNVTMKEIKDEQENYKVNIYYPKTKYKVLNDEINENMTKIYEEFKSKAINLELEKPYIEITYNINDITINENEIISVIFNINSQLEKTHPNNDFYTINYSITNNKIIKIDDLILKNKDILDIFSKISYETLKNNEKIKEYIGEAELKKSLNNGKTIYSVFSFDKNGIVIYFNTYNLAPFAAGSFNVLVRYSEFQV